MSKIRLYIGKNMHRALRFHFEKNDCIPHKRFDSYEECLKYIQPMIIKPISYLVLDAGDDNLCLDYHSEKLEN